jgi:toxin CcdB
MAQFDVHRNLGAQRSVISPLHMVSIAVERMGERVASLREDGDRVIAAIDLLISRAWD